MKERFAKYAWFVLAYNIAVVLWGAFVRATGSGAGCGEHWPLCNGEVVPRAPKIATIIEFGHRITSGMVLVLVVLLVIFAYRTFPPRHVVRRTAVLSLAFTISEALIGAALVLLGHGATNTSVWRGATLSIHLVNTLVLLASLALTAWFATPKTYDVEPLEIAGRLRLALGIAAGAVLVVGISGAIAALGDTLFASSSVSEGFRRDFSPSAHLFLRLRILHPVIAAGLGAYLLAIAFYAAIAKGATVVLKRLAFSLIGLTLLQVCLGLVNIMLLAPIPVQLLHLMVADLLWITFILFSTEILAPVGYSVPVRSLPRSAAGTLSPT
jgi:heme A synthase